MAYWNIEIEEKAKADDIRYVVGQLQAFNDAHTPTPFQRREVRLFVRDPTGAIIAGLFANVNMHCLAIQILWVDDSVRRQGIGWQLMETAEQMARDAGARQAIVETTSFQAPQFYQKMGYTVIHEIPDCPIGASTWLMRKWL